MSHVRVCTVLAMLSKSDLSLFAFYKESQDLQKMAEKRVGQDCQSRPFACGAIFYFYLINGLAYSRRELDFCKCVWRVVDTYVHKERRSKVTGVKVAPRKHRKNQNKSARNLMLIM